MGSLFGFSNPWANSSTRHGTKPKHDGEDDVCATETEYALLETQDQLFVDQKSNQRLSANYDDSGQSKQGQAGNVMNNNDYTAVDQTQARDSYSSLLRARHSSLRARAEAQGALNRHVQLHAAAAKSQQQFIDLMHLAKGEQNWEVYHERLSEASERLENHYQALAAHFKTVQSTQGRLANLQYGMRELENALFTNLECFLRSAGLLDTLSPDEDWLREAMRHDIQSSRSASLDSRLEAYYDNAGDVGLFREKLITLEMEHQDALVTRNLLAEQERVPSISDSQFELDYQEARSSLIQHLKDATNATQLARQICLDAGLRPESSELSYSEPLAHDLFHTSADEADKEQCHPGHGQELPSRSLPRARSSLTLEHLKYHSGTSAAPDIAERDGRGNQNRAYIADWASKLGSSPPRPKFTLTRADIEKLPDFAGNPQASFEQIEKPRRCSSTTHLRRVVSVQADVEHSSKPLGLSNVGKRISLRDLQSQWDLSDIVRTRHGCGVAD